MLFFEPTLCAAACLAKVVLLSTEWLSQSWSTWNTLVTEWWWCTESTWATVCWWTLWKEINPRNLSHNQPNNFIYKKCTWKAWWCTRKCWLASAKTTTAWMNAWMSAWMSTWKTTAWMSSWKTWMSTWKTRMSTWKTRMSTWVTTRMWETRFEAYTHLAF